MNPRRPPAPSDPGRRPVTSGGGRGRPAGSTPTRAGRPGHAPASRPAASNRPRPGSAGRAEGPRGGTRAGSGRPLWVLGAVGIVLALLILPYFQKWLVQRSELESARNAVAQSRRDVADLEAQRARWADDEYVKAQARQRLNFVMPGDIGLVVVDPQDRTPTTEEQRARLTPQIPAGERPWYSAVWLSAQVAGDPKGTAAP
jgi:Septum formation initiator